MVACPLPPLRLTDCTQPMQEWPPPLLFKKTLHFPHILSLVLRSYFNSTIFNFFHFIYIKDIHIWSSNIKSTMQWHPTLFDLRTFFYAFLWQQNNTFCLSSLLLFTHESHISQGLFNTLFLHSLKTNFPVSGLHGIHWFYMGKWRLRPPKIYAFVYISRLFSLCRSLLIKISKLLNKYRHFICAALGSVI